MNISINEVIPFPSVMPNILNRESIFVSVQMDPRQPLAGMTENVRHSRH